MIKKLSKEQEEKLKGLSDSQVEMMKKFWENPNYIEDVSEKDQFYFLAEEAVKENPYHYSRIRKDLRTEELCLELVINHPSFFPNIE